MQLNLTYSLNAAAGLFQCPGSSGFYRVFHTESFQGGRSLILGEPELIPCEQLLFSPKMQGRSWKTIALNLS